LKNYVNVPSKIIRQKNLEKISFYWSLEGQSLMVQKVFFLEEKSKNKIFN
jgi:hypothetical protein